jgi:hypothetical protein
MIPANGAPHDLEACDVLRSFVRAASTTFTRSISMSAASRSPFASNTTPSLSAQIEDQPRRCVLTAFAIGTGLGPAQAARHFDEPYPLICSRSFIVGTWDRILCVPPARMYSTYTPNASYQRSGDPATRSRPMAASSPHGTITPDLLPYPIREDRRRCLSPRRHELHSLFHALHPGRRL